MVPQAHPYELGRIDRRASPPAQSTGSRRILATTHGIIPVRGTVLGLSHWRRGSVAIGIVAVAVSRVLRHPVGGRLNRTPIRHGGLLRLRACRSGVGHWGRGGPHGDHLTAIHPSFAAHLHAHRVAVGGQGVVANTRTLSTSRRTATHRDVDVTAAGRSEGVVRLDTDGAAVATATAATAVREQTKATACKQLGGHHRTDGQSKNRRGKQLFHGAYSSLNSA